MAGRRLVALDGAPHLTWRHLQRAFEEVSRGKLTVRA